MPDMPSYDVDGLVKLMSIILVSLGVFWGIHKAIQLAKRG